MQDAHKLHQAGDFAGAIAQMNSAIQVDPDDTDKGLGTQRPMLRFALACSQAQQGLVEDAFVSLTRAVGLDSHTAPTRWVCTATADSVTARCCVCVISVLAGV